MRKILIVSLFLFLFAKGFSQNNEKDPEVNMITYHVKLGETVRLISKKYLVAPSEIYKYNKFATDGISEGMVLYIPVPVKETVYTESEEIVAPHTTPKHVVVKEHESVTNEVAVKKVAPIEVVSAEVPKDKPEAVTTTTTATNYPISTAEEIQSADIVSTTDPNTVKHKVQKQETLYGLSKVYNITVDELKEQNKVVLKNGLQIGQILTITKNN